MLTPKSLTRRGQAYNAQVGFDETSHDHEAATVIPNWQVILLDPRDYNLPAINTVYPSPAASATIEELSDSPTPLQQGFDPARGFLAYNADQSPIANMPQGRSNNTNYHGYSTHPGAPKHFRPGQPIEEIEQTSHAALISQNRNEGKAVVDSPPSGYQSGNYQPVCLSQAFERQLMSSLVS